MSYELFSRLAIGFSAFAVSGLVTTCWMAWRVRCMQHQIHEDLELMAHPDRREEIREVLHEFWNSPAQLNISSREMTQAEFEEPTE